MGALFVLVAHPALFFFFFIAGRTLMVNCAGAFPHNVLVNPDDLRVEGANRSDGHLIDQQCNDAFPVISISVM